MPLPVNCPCNHCKGDRLHVWDAQTRAWRCNDCHNIKQRAKRRPIDEFMRRRLYRKLK